MTKQYIVYSKICIICANNFDTFKVNSLYCSKKCRNRVRYLPQHIINSLIEKYSQFTSVKKFGDSITSQPQVLRNMKFTSTDVNIATGLARVEADKRGIKRSVLVDDNIDFINTTDPALGDSTGFGKHPDNTKEQEVQNEGNHNNNDSSNNAKVSIKTGIRKIGKINN